MLLRAPRRKICFSAEVGPLVTEPDSRYRRIQSTYSIKRKCLKTGSTQLIKEQCNQENWAFKTCKTKVGNHEFPLLPKVSSQ